MTSKVSLGELGELARRLELANKNLSRERTRLAELRRCSETLWQQILANGQQRVAAPAHLPASTDLTARETEVLRLIAEGHSSREIGTRLGIAFKTAVCHRTRLMTKLRIHDTAGLVRYAIRHNVIEA